MHRCYSLQLLIMLSLNIFSVSREEKIRQTIQKIRSIQGDKGKSIPTTSTKNKKSRDVEEIVDKVGWLHRSSKDCLFRQVRITEGGGVRMLTFKEGKSITPEEIIEGATRWFFKNGQSKYGELNKMNMCLGNYNKKEISMFETTDGKKCSYLEFLKDQGLHKSKVTFYLMTTHQSRRNEKI